MDRILFGDNQFFGVNHVSDEKSRAQMMKFKEDKTILRTIDIAREKSLPVADHGFIDSIRLNFEGKLIKCYYLGAAHTLDNIVVWIPSENILFPGCMVKSINSTSLGNIADGDLKAYPGTIDRLIQKFSTAKIVVPGHGQPGGPELLFHTRDLLGK